jgi:hypothetical protein
MAAREGVCCNRWTEAIGAAIEAPASVPFDSAPAHRLAVEEGDQAARRIRPRVAAVGLLPEAEGELVGPDRRPRLAGLHLEPLAPASGRIAARAEDGLDVVPARLVGGNDREFRRSRRIGHDADGNCAMTTPSGRWIAWAGVLGVVVVVVVVVLLVGVGFYATTRYTWNTSA